MGFANLKELTEQTLDPLLPLRLSDRLSPKVETAEDDRGPASQPSALVDPAPRILDVWAKHGRLRGADRSGPHHRAPPAAAILAGCQVGTPSLCVRPSMRL